MEEYFERLLNAPQRRTQEELNHPEIDEESDISPEEVKWAIKYLKRGKFSVLDGIRLEMVKNSWRST